MREIVYENTVEILNLMFSDARKETNLLCPKCSAILIIITDWPEAKEKGRHPGVYCPKDSGHVVRLFNIERD